MVFDIEVWRRDTRIRGKRKFIRIVLEGVKLERKVKLKNLKA